MRTSCPLCPFSGYLLYGNQNVTDDFLSEGVIAQLRDLLRVRGLEITAEYTILSSDRFCADFSTARDSSPLH